MSTRRQSNEQQETRPDTARMFRWFSGLVLLLIVALLCLVAALMLFFLLQGQELKNVIEVEGGQVRLNPVERIYLQGYLASKVDDLNQPIGTGNASFGFVIEPGQRADQIATNLVEAGHLNDATLLINFLRYNGLDSQLEAGTYQLSTDLTIPELAQTLVHAFPQEVELRFIEGWRLEEMIAYLAAVRPANIDPEEFRSIVQRQTSFNINDYGFMASLPNGVSLEGFLFPDTYQVPTDAEASTLVNMMLDNFDRRVTPAMRQAFGVQGLSVYEALTLASVVQREAVLVEEQPKMVSVFLNRLEQGMPLQADPTVQYALGYHANSDQWWKAPLTQSDMQVDSPYNTYLYDGLPPGPIANPGLDALNAVAGPEESNFLFFVVDCEADIPGTHVFSLSFEEHLTHVERCR